MTKDDQSDVQSHVLSVMSHGHVRVAVLGNVDAGKSTLIGTLCHSQLDNGNGFTRNLVTKYKHELESGRTSTITTHLMGFDEHKAMLVPPKSTGYKSMGNHQFDAHLARLAHERTVTLMDVAGHEKYFKTTIDGLSRGMADYAFVLVNASQGWTFMTAHHFSVCQVCGIPAIVVITKLDSTYPEVLKHTLKIVADGIRAAETGTRRYAVRKPSDIDQVVNKMHALVPIVEVSCVTGEGLDLLRKMLVDLPKRRMHHNKIKRPFELLVEEQFNVPGVGLVLSGFVNSGKTKKGEAVCVGPLKNGSFVKTMIKSIHVARTVVDEVWAGHSACFAVSLSKKQKNMLPRKGLVLVNETMTSPVVGFSAEIVLAKGDSVTMVAGRTQTTVHILHLKTSCKLQDFKILDSAVRITGSSAADDENNTVLRPGQRAMAKFEFMEGPKYVRTGMRVIIRDGHVRGVGMIKQVHEA